jgi:hypothetical protein
MASGSNLEEMEKTKMNAWAFVIDSRCMAGNWNKNKNEIYPTRQILWPFSGRHDTPHDDTQHNNKRLLVLSVLILAVIYI